MVKSRSIPRLVYAGTSGLKVWTLPVCTDDNEVDRGFNNTFSKVLHHFKKFKIFNLSPS